MPTERETREVTIGKHKFVVKTYATARESQAIQQTLFKGAKFEVVGDQPKFNQFDPAVMFEMQKELIRQMVVSMDGKTDPLEDCLNFPTELFDDLVAELDKLVAKKKK